MSIRISSSKRPAGVKVRPSRPTYENEEENDNGVKEVNDEGQTANDDAKEGAKEKIRDRRNRRNRGRHDSEENDRNNNRNERDEEKEESSARRDDEEDDTNEHQQQNGTTELMEPEGRNTAKASPPVSPELTPSISPMMSPPISPKPTKKAAPKVPAKHSSIIPSLGPKKDNVWPPVNPKKYDAFAVEGHGRMNPYTRELIPDEDENPPEPEDKRLEIDEGHTAPVKQLRKNWQGQKDERQLGVTRPAASMKGEKEWIKHVKPAVEYEAPPKEPEWLQLVRNRRWNSTVKARFPCNSDDIVDFERRSTTPKNWKRLLLDKKAVRTIGQITGIGAEGEELLWRLAKQRGKVDEKKEFVIPGQKDTLAYEHIKGNLEAAVADVAMQGLEASEFGDDTESEFSQPSVGHRDRISSTSSIQQKKPSAATIRQRLLRLHPEEFKKLLALDRARDAHLRWQFSTDPYDSVHEHQMQSFEIALLAGERENRLRYLLKKLLRPEDMPSPNASGSTTPSLRKTRGNSLPGSSYTSDQESDSGSSAHSHQREGRSKKKPPVPLPRKGRSVSPSFKDSDEDIVHGFLGTEDDDIAEELRKLEDMAKGMGLPKEITDLLCQNASKGEKRRERPGDGVSAGLEGRMRNLLSDSDMQKLQKAKMNADLTEAGITQSLADRKQGFLDEAEKAKSFRKEESEVEDSEIDTEEMASRRRKFLSQEKEAMNVPKIPQKSKARHKVQRIKSDAELYAVMSKRRIATDDDDTATDEASNEMKGLLQDITKTFGGEQYKGLRKSRFQSSDESETMSFEEKQEDEDLKAEEEDEEEEDAPVRRSRRDARGSGRKGGRQRARKWSESEESEEQNDESGQLQSQFLQSKSSLAQVD